MIRAQSVRVERGIQTVLHDISIEVRPGEVVAIVGPNGDGKSTFLGALSGDLVPTGGSVMIGGRDVQRMSMAERARCRAVLPQHSTLAFPFSVSDVVLLGRLPFNDGAISRRDRAIAADAMERSGVSHLRERLYTTLSGGERQRVQLARVLSQILGEEAKGERYLFLDEPTSSLDLAHQHSTLEVARTMADDGCGVIAILHDLNLAACYADRVAILLDGRIVTCGAPREVLTPSIIMTAFGVDVVIIEHPHRNVPVVISGTGGPLPGAEHEQSNHHINYQSIS